MKTDVIERNQAKLLSAEEDIKDLCAEFEIDRQDYLDTIRNQEKTIKLYEQLLGTVVPCLRRDCNYFNIDKVRVECSWDDEAHQWVLPKLTTSKTILSPASLPRGGGLLDRRGTKGTNATGQSSSRHSSSSDINAKDSLSSLLRAHPSATHPGSSDNLDEDKYMSHMRQKSDESVGYFKPKRALELIGHSPHSPHSPHSTKDGLSPIHNHANDTGPMKGSGSLSSLPNAAMVHGVDPLLDSSYGRRPGKLQSLARNPPMPQAFSTHQEPDILEKMEKKRRNKSLEPLADIKTKRPQL